MRLIIGTARSPVNPLMRAVWLLVGAVALVVAFFFGAVILAFIIGLAIIFAAIVSVRMWWLGRKLRKSGIDPQADSVYIHTRFESARQRAETGNRVIEGECTDVSEDDSSRQP